MIVDLPGVWNKDIRQPLTHQQDDVRKAESGIIPGVKADNLIGTFRGFAGELAEFNKSHAITYSVTM